MGNDVQRWRVTWKSGFLLFLVAAVVYGALTAARGASLLAAVIGALVFGAIFVPLFARLARWRSGRGRGQGGL